MANTLLIVLYGGSSYREVNVLQKKDANLKQKPELVIGLVARMGVEIPNVLTALKSEAAKYNFKFVHIKVTGFLERIDHKCDLYDSPVEARYRSYIECCNKIREKAENNSVFSLLTMNAIELSRQSHQSGGHRGVMIVVDQLKRKEEIEAFRAVYDDAFIALSCHSPFEKRVKYIKEKIIADHSETDDDARWDQEAKDLISLDESEGKPFGQDVRSTFPKADYILDASNRSRSDEGLSRFFRILFSDPGISPSFEEYGNNMAAQAAYRSIDLSRQVGAAIFDNSKKVVALGSNEVPKAGGGTYWVNSKSDGRDQKKGYDINTIRKRSLVIDIVELLKANGKLTGDLAGLDPEKLNETLLSGDDGILKASKILDILEYGRALHAEMNAITDAARTNTSTQDTILFVTTFPCHNCAKHIVGSGIKTVFYLEPYSKSEVSRLYPDSISIDPANKIKNKIPFKQFCGITKRRFHYFAKEKLKDSTGKVFPWKESNAVCFIDKHPNDYRRLEETYRAKLKDMVDFN